MGDSNTLFNQEEARVKKFEQLAGDRFTESMTDIAYRELNSRYVNLEEKTLSSKDRTEKKQHLLARKKQIESEWVNNTGGNALQMVLRASNDNPKSVEYYANYSTKEMEVLLKNNERGGNSTLYNDVVTDLELYNLAKDDVTEEKDRIDLLRRIKSSCDSYISSRHPFSSSGKVRKAMISRVAQQVEEELAKFGEQAFAKEETKEDDSVQTEAIAQAQGVMTISDVHRTFEAFKSDQTNEAALYAAAQAHFDMISKVLQGQIQLKEADVAKLDDQMSQICSKIKTLPIDPDQNDVMSTRFFNVLGWTSHKPDLVSPDDFEYMVRESKLGTPMYHCIQANTDSMSGVTMARQFVSDQGQKQYMSDGMYGKGTYLAVDVGRADYTAADVSNHCWTSYGKTTGSVQFTMFFNEKAKVIEDYQLNTLMRQFGEKFGKLYNTIKSSEVRGRRISGDPTYSMFAAFFGYNVIKGSMGIGLGDKKGDYYVAIDRGALTVSDTIEVRSSGNDDFETRQMTLRRED